MERLTPTMLAAIPKERDLISFSVGADLSGRGLVFKYVMKNGATERLFLGPMVSLFLKNSIVKAWKDKRRTDVRRRAGDKRPEVAIIARFLEGRPPITDADFDSADGEVQQPIGLEFQGFDDALFLGFAMGNDIYKILRLPWAITPYLREWIEAYEADGFLPDLSATPPASHRGH